MDARVATIKLWRLPVISPLADILSTATMSH
jgi:hypothetical protein